MRSQLTALGQGVDQHLENAYLQPSQAIIDSLPERNAARDGRWSMLASGAARTGVGVAEGVGGAVVGKTLGGFLNLGDGDQPRAETQAQLQAVRERAQRAQKAAAARARN